MKNNAYLKSVLFIFCLIGFSYLFSGGSLGPMSKSNQGTDSVVGASSVSSLTENYKQWSQAYAATKPTGPVISLLWSKGLSKEFSNAKGIVQLNVETGNVSVRIKGLEDPEISDVWLVDNLPGPGKSVLPEQSDRMLKLGSLEYADGNSWLDTNIPDAQDFPIDLVVVVRRDGLPSQGGVLVGTTSLFQKIFHYPNQNAKRLDQTELASSDFSLISEANATAGITPQGFFPDLNSSLINQGRRLFFNETFNGNGRTCGTCHKEDDNMALSLKTIAALPDDDPLFIVEQEFRQDGITPNDLFNNFKMEKPALMRKLGLIVENLDGFRNRNGNFTNRVAMRSPQHVLSIRTTLAPPPLANDDGTLPVNALDLVFAERTGWAGDGTPTGFVEDFFESNGRNLTGSLRDFTIGAITQHFPLTLERSAFDVDENNVAREPDFRFATESELDALEAFMISIGRQQENQSLDEVQLVDEVADRGRQNYMGFNVFDGDPNDGRPALNCNSCHFNGGANTNPEFPFPPSVTPNHDIADIIAAGGSIPSHNRSFAPQVERLADQPGDIITQVVDDPSVRGNCFNQGLAEIPLLPDDVPDGIEIANGGEATASRGCNRNRFDNGFLFRIGDRRSLNNSRVARDRFNAPPVFEAMDNPPFFHGHQVNTVEGSVAFYATNRHLRDGTFLPAIVPLNASQVINVARFMRVMGADFNADSAITLSLKALDLNSPNNRRTNARLALAEVNDAIELLDPVDLHITDALPLFREARHRLEFASNNGNRNRLAQAITSLEAAQAAMLIRN